MTHATCGRQTATAGDGARLSGLCLIALWILASSGCARQSVAETATPQRGEEDGLAVHMFDDEPPARALYDGMIQTLRTAGSFSCRSSYRWANQGRELGQATYHLWLKKPGYARMEGFHEGRLMGTLVGDGEQFWIFWPDQRPMFSSEEEAEYERSCSQVYMRDAIPADKYSIAHQAMKLGAGMSMLILQPSVFHGQPGSLETYLDAVRLIGSEEVDGEPCDVVEVGYMKGQRSKIYWIARRDALPRRLKEIVRVGVGDIVSEESWTDVRLNEPIPDSTFAWAPPADWTQWQMPDIRQGILAAGTPAPAFELPALDGRSISLPQLRGNVVWLVFWRLGCPPCRVEFPELERLHQQFADQGLVVLGFNCADEKELATQYLAANGITFTNIVDNSDAAQKICFELYQRPGASAVPLNYIIDREGRVAAGWYGYDKEDRTPHNVLQALGIH